MLTASKVCEGDDVFRDFVGVLARTLSVKVRVLLYVGEDVRVVGVDGMLHVSSISSKRTFYQRRNRPSTAWMIRFEHERLVKALLRKALSTTLNYLHQALYG